MPTSIGIRPRQLFYQPSARHVWFVIAVRAHPRVKDFLEVRIHDEAGDAQLITTIGDTLRLGEEDLQPMTGTCKICGCSTMRACPGGCWWWQADVCTRHETRS